MSGLGKRISLATTCLCVAALIALAPSIASAKQGGGVNSGSGKSSGGMGSAMGKKSAEMGGGKGKSGATGSWGGSSSSSGKSKSGNSSNSTANSGKSTDHPHHHDHDGDYAHDHDHNYHHHHYPYYGGFPVIFDGNISGDYIASDYPYVETVVPTPQFYAAAPSPQVYTVYFKDRSGNSQTYGQFDAAAEGDRLAQTQDRLTAAGVAWWTVDSNGAQVDTDINK